MLDKAALIAHLATRIANFDTLAFSDGMSKNLVTIFKSKSAILTEVSNAIVSGHFDTPEYQELDAAVAEALGGANDA